MLPELWTVPGTEWSIKSYGFLMMVGFLSSVYLAMRRAANVKCDPDVVLNCSFIALVTGIVGARIFYVVHYWDQSFSYVPNPLWAAVNISAGGLEIYGGLISAIILVPLYLAVTKRSIRLYMEILAIATMWALGVARIGCFLNGCCFGGVCADANGQANNAWAVQFPFASPALVRQWQERRITLPAELITDNYGRGGGQQLEAFPLSREMLSMSPEKRSKPFRRFEKAEELYQQAKAIDPDSEETQKLFRQYEVAKRIRDKHRNEINSFLLAKRFPSRQDPKRDTTLSELKVLAAQYPAVWTYPSQLYSAVSGILISILLARIFHHRKRHGVVFLWMIILYGITRFVLELIRTDNPTDVAGLTVAQAISIGMVAIGLALMFVLYRFFPERSPRAVPFVPEPKET